MHRCSEKTDASHSAYFTTISDKVKQTLILVSDAINASRSPRTLFCSQMGFRVRKHALPSATPSAGHLGKCHKTEHIMNTL